ncbi:MAG: bifunctional molybdenum cofactor biosynthesis protein MoaC/MoaB [Candidatus Marinimicrobia bacterium]|nr:bifunctional molybdenum cofactor biosynthesis protein MoaC/MoaB [Candidatus Neomarinimicrobiota bacterium]
MLKKLSHMDEDGNIKMVDVTEKTVTVRTAKASGLIRMKPETIQLLLGDNLPKGNVFTTAKIAGIQAAKKTAELIPLCHPLNISWVGLQFITSEDQIYIEAVAKTKDATGIEMEVLTAVSVAALTIYDMCKSVDKEMTISDIRLLEKTGGKSVHATDFRPKVGIITLSDGVASGHREDISGKILLDGFKNSGCEIAEVVVLPDESENLKKTIETWVQTGVRLILTTGGTGLGPRDSTIQIMEPLLEQKLPGVEQALHAYGRSKKSTAMLSRLMAGTIRKSIVICLPGNPSAAKDALTVLIPSIFHAFPIMEGEGHS